MRLHKSPDSSRIAFTYILIKQKSNVLMRRSPTKSWEVTAANPYGETVDCFCWGKKGPVKCAADAYNNAHPSNPKTVIILQKDGMSITFFFKEEMSIFFEPLKWAKEQVFTVDFHLFKKTRCGPDRCF